MRLFKQNRLKMLMELALLPPQAQPWHAMKAQRIVLVLTMVRAAGALYFSALLLLVFSCVALSGLRLSEHYSIILRNIYSELFKLDSAGFMRISEQKWLVMRMNIAMLPIGVCYITRPDPNLFGVAHTCQSKPACQKLGVTLKFLNLGSGLVL